MDVLADMLKSDGLTAEPDAPAAKEAEAPQEDDPFASLFAKGEKSKWVNFRIRARARAGAQSRRRGQLDPDMQRRIEAMARAST